MDGHYKKKKMRHNKRRTVQTWKPTAWLMCAKQETIDIQQQTKATKIKAPDLRNAHTKHKSFPG